jgi:hypothetical protein
MLTKACTGSVYWKVTDSIVGFVMYVLISTGIANVLDLTIAGPVCEQYRMGVSNAELKAELSVELSVELNVELNVELTCGTGVELLCGTDMWN